MAAFTDELAWVDMPDGYAPGALTYSLPLGAKLDAARGAGTAGGDGSVRLRVMPVGSMAGMEEAGAVELLAVSVESY